MISYSQLPPEWAEYLRQRGVTPEVARARGYRYVRQGKPLDGDYAASWGFPQKASGMLIPLGGVLDDVPEASVQLRLDKPEDFPDKLGRPTKFLSPRGQRNVLATSPLTRDLLAEPEQVLIICEGVSRVDALARYRIPAVAIAGIDNWKTGRPPVALPDFDSIGIRGNKIILAPDGDISKNKQVNSAVTRLSTWLNGKGADAVHILTLPDELGLDDWLALKDFTSAESVIQAMRAHLTEKAPKIHAPPPAPEFEVKDAGPWSASPAGDMRRLLEYRPDSLCVVRPAVRDLPWRLLVAGQGGRWYGDEAQVGNMLIDSTLAWQTKVTEAVLRGQLEPQQARLCTNWAVQSAKATGRKEALAMLGTIYLWMGTHGMLPDGITVCEEGDVDADRYTLGAKNGVIDLRTGQLMAPREARGRFVTRSIPDDFNPNARHPLAGDLMAHLQDSDRGYMQSGIGYGLKGHPGRRMYALNGQRGGGKSTLLEAILAALGDVRTNGYGMRLAIEAILRSRWDSGSQGHHGNLFGLQDARIAITEEPPANRRFNEALLKDLTGGTSQAFRDVKEKAGPGRPVRATIIVAMNSGQEVALDISDDALAGRVRILPYPALPGPEDTARIKRVSEDPSVRQAVMATLVEAATKTEDPPQDVPNVREHTAQRRRDSIGPLGQWLEDRLEVTGMDRDVVNLTELWRLIADDLGAEDDKGRIEGRTREEAWRLAREIHANLPRVRTTRKGSEWRGVRLRADDEIAAATCVRCGQELTQADAATNGSLEFVNTCRRCQSHSGGVGTGQDGADPAGTVVQGLMRDTLLVRLGLMEVERAGRVASIRDTLDHEGLQELTQAMFALRSWMNSNPDVILRPEHVAGSESRLVALVERIARQNWRMVDDAYDWTPLTLDLRAVAEQYLEKSLEPREEAFSDVLRRWFQPPLMSIEGVQGGDVVRLWPPSPA